MCMVVWLLVWPGPTCPVISSMTRRRRARHLRQQKLGPYLIGVQKARSTRLSPSRLLVCTPIDFQDRDRVAKGLGARGTFGATEREVRLRMRTAPPCIHRGADKP
ncbi:hypothetical protein OH76DRAFT_884813 [Lentinus brumalis]|uniref:Secreted protein n=1 Tax=Lentinus brumalis TaxID=2498619 RepID=A0A371D199_9APHY|nr:hypothetical protein OH76DRAFT_884813 [Polyporus brumalis]